MAQQYRRPTNDKPLSPAEKEKLLPEYFAYYEEIARTAPHLLNVKLERATFSEVLDQVGGLLLKHSKRFASSAGPMREFLDATAPPDCIRDRLPDEFRTFCLLLNALKQWVSAESAATDWYLLGGTAREQCRQMAGYCLVTGRALGDQDTELHHLVRDGRPPIPLSKMGHNRIESTHGDGDDLIYSALSQLKKKGRRSWKMLRQGCIALDSGELSDATPGVLANSKSFARKAAKATGLSYHELLDWLDRRVNLSG